MNSVMPLLGDEIADRDRDLRGGEVQRPAGLGAVDRPEQLEVDAVAQDDDAVRVDPESDHRVLEGPGHGDDAACGLRRRHDAPTRTLEPRDVVDVAAAGGDDEGFPQPAGNHRRGHPVGIEVVRVDQIELEAAAPETGDLPPRRPGERRRLDGHPDLREHEVAGMDDLDSVAALRPGGSREGAIVAEDAGAAREPRHRGDDRGTHGVRGQEPPEPGLDEDPVPRPHRAREERRQREEPNRPLGVLRYRNPGMRLTLRDRRHRRQSTTASAVGRRSPAGRVAVTPPIRRRNASNMSSDQSGALWSRNPD